MSVYNDFQHSRSAWGMDVLKGIFIEITTESGHQGYATAYGGYISSWIIKNHLNRFLIGADARNLSKLYELKTKTFIYSAIVKGSFKDSEFPVERELKLKVGAQVMVAKNDTDPEKRWVNGSIGVIQHLSKDEVKVLIKEKLYTIGKAKWEKFNYQINGSFIQQLLLWFFVV
jgi:hypothetical protein